MTETRPATGGWWWTYGPLLLQYVIAVLLFLCAAAMDVAWISAVVFVVAFTVFCETTRTVWITYRQRRRRNA